MIRAMTRQTNALASQIQLKGRKRAATTRHAAKKNSHPRFVHSKADADGLSESICIFVFRI
ncbi:hypothetical protein XavaCFBP5823_19190 [Xanthomonas axonopodis pv. vasculorum]|nr:hypothetical protein XavaCFBP5823_19190 [Xanthomonas axonopodis pv. vasculorum]